MWLYSGQFLSIQQWMTDFIDIVFGPDKNGNPRYMYWIDGTIFTLELTLLALLIGLLIGMVVALMKLSDVKLVRIVGTLYTDIIRGTPAMIQIMFIYFVVFASSNMPKLLVGAIAFGINSGAYVAEIIRAGINGVDKGQMEAARSLGLSRSQSMISIIIPQAIKNILPTLVSEFIVLLKETAVVGFIAGFDITKAATSISAQTYSAAEPLLMATFIYLTLTTIFTAIMRKVEGRLSISDSRKRLA